MAGPLSPRRRVLCDEASLLDLEARARRMGEGGDGGPWPEGWRVVSERPSRVVVRALLRGPEGALPCYVKFHRRRGRFDAIKGRIRVARGPAEGRALETLAGLGVDVPAVVAWSTQRPAGTTPGGFDLLATAEVEGLDLVAFARAPRPRAERTRAARAVGRLLEAAHRAGWRDADVHRGNVVVDGDRAVLVDPGTRPAPGVPLSRRARIRGLGRALHGLAPGPTDALRALHAYLGQRRAEAPAWAGAVDRAARDVARRYRSGRARRATRTGRHFTAFRVAAAEGVRRNATASAEAEAALAGLLRGDGAAGARPLKSDGSVFLWRGGGLAGDVVVKRFEPRRRDRFRVPRALRAFRRAYAIGIRGIACPRPVAALSTGDGAGVYAAEWLRQGEEGAPDLDRAVRARDGRASAFAALSPAERRDALHALGRFLRRLHDADVSHRDLKAPNLVARRDGRLVSFAIVDLEGARVRRRGVSWRRRARDLARLDASLAHDVVSSADRARVRRGYLAARRRAPVDERAFARWIEAAGNRKRATAGVPR